MSKRYFQKADASKPIVTDKYTFTFTPSHRNMASGGSWGIIELEDAAQAEALAKVARSYGAFEISEDDAIKALQKKSSLNPNRVFHTPSASQENAGRVEAKSDGVTSSVEDFDELMGGGEPAAKPDTTTLETESEAPAQDAEITEPEIEDPAPEITPTIEPEPTPKKRRGRPRKKKAD
jgi:hypothetical protein